ncbi:unnamed protein product [marine sediment metagenome]|uniref:Uncharacterized protein n=1 Tax=marine sediment metagenome TaxID=412755 RepID=X1URQ2_9ZZZZ
MVTATSLLSGTVSTVIDTSPPVENRENPVAALYFLGVKKLEEGDSATAKRTSLIVGIIGGVIGLAMLLYSQFTGAIVILVVIPALLAWYKLEQKS